MRITIGGHNVEVDTPEDLPVATTFEVSDLMDPSSSKGARSNSLEFPQTISNSFLGVRDMSAPLRDRTLKEFVLSNGAGVIWSGVAVPESIGRDAHKWKLYGDSAAWFDRVKERSLSDLDLGVGDVHSVTSVMNTWDTSNGLNHLMGVVDYGNFTNKDAGYDVSLSYIYPAVSVRAIVDRLFADLGYRPVFKGAIGAHIDKLYLLFTEKSEELRATDETLEGLVVKAEGYSVTPISEFPSTEVPETITFATTTEDPAGQFDGTVFTPQYTGRYTFKFKFKGQFSEQVQRFWFTLRNGVLGNNASSVTFYKFRTPGTYDDEVIKEEANLTAGVGYNLFISASPFEHTFTILSSSFEIVPTFIPWQEGLTPIISSALPKMKQGDLVAGLIGAFNCACITDPMRREVIFSPLDTWRKPIDQALNWSAKLDIEEEPVLKVRDGVPKVFEFRCEEDSADRTLAGFATTNGRGLGDHDHVTTDENANGVVELTVPWAATASGTCLGTNIVPALLKKDQDNLDEPTYGWKPRLVYWAGMKDATWVLDGQDMTQLPDLRFIAQGSEFADLSLAFASNGGEYGDDVGLVDRLHSSRLASAEFARIVECNLYLNDEDIRRLDFSRPVNLRIAGTMGTYYLLKVDEYLWGQGVSTPCRLIQATPHYPPKQRPKIRQEITRVTPRR